jgi:hypothetical protein
MVSEANISMLIIFIINTRGTKKKRNIKNEEKIKKKLIEKLLNDEEFVN